MNILSDRIIRPNCETHKMNWEGYAFYALRRVTDRPDVGIDPMTADGGIMFRGKRLSREEYKALPAREKAQWQDEANRPSI